MSDRYRLCARGCLLRRVRGIVAVVLLAVFAAANTASQVFAQPRGELTDAIRVDEPAPMVRNQLERVRVNIAERQWDAGVEGLRQLMENHGERLVRLDSRFVSLRELGHMELVKLAPEGLALYRGRVDPQAQRWYEDGVKKRDAALLKQVVDEFFASSFGDDALLALGEIMLERGMYQRARECWERISPQLRAADGLPLWVAQRSANTSGKGTQTPFGDTAGNNDGATSAAWLAYPDTDLNLADVRARLVLVSLLDGARDRAETEYKSFIEMHPDAAGRLAGRDGLYRETLAALIEAADEWPAAPTQESASTFGGNQSRNWIAPGEFALRSLAWPEPITLADKRLRAFREASREFRLPEDRIAEDASALLSFHPLVVGNLVVFHDLHCVYVYDLQTGRPAWQQGAANARPGQVYPRGRVEMHGSEPSYTQSLGVSRFTATVYGSYLFVRLGSQVTSWPETSTADKRGSLVVLDLAQQGKLIAELKPDDDRWAFEGPPVCDGSRFYVAMRYNDVRPQSHVACYEITATTGPAGTTHTPHLRWRRMVCAAESPAGGATDEITHNLLTLAEGRLYLNTNLGAVASLSAEDGRIHWLSTYRRAKTGPDNAHLFRDLNPCVYHRGALYVAPTDSPQIFAFDAMTGLVRWATVPTPTADIVHLLGVAEGSLIASGKQLWWLDAETGKVVTSFPNAMEVNQARPLGRGILIGDVAIWPTRGELRVFHQKQSPSSDANTLPAMPRDPIRLADYHQGLSGGNLVAAGQYVLLATADKLWAFGPKWKEEPAENPNDEIQAVNQ